MSRLRHSFLWFCLIANSIAAYRQKRYTQQPEPIGKGVKVHVQVLYDKTLFEEYSARRLEGGPEAATLEDFRAMFRKVQEVFNNASVMIEIIVGSITKNDNLSVIFHGMQISLDGPETLDHLKKYGEGQTKSNDTVFYYFTRRDILRATKRGDQIPIELMTIETPGSFCTQEVSAALVRYWSGAYQIPAEALARIFGSLRYPRFYRRDRMLMNKTFSYLMIAYKLTAVEKRHCHVSASKESQRSSDGGVVEN